MPYVGPEGPKTATIAIVGEKPGRYEVQAGRPFYGPSGRELTSLLSKIGINRSAVYVTNAVKNITNFDNPSPTEIKAEIPSLLRELGSLPNLRVVVPMGLSALQACSAFQLNSIASYRGSILPSLLPGIKMIPTFHPAFYMRGEWRFKSIVRFDLSRALEESYERRTTQPIRYYHIAQDRNDLDAIAQSLSGAKYLSFDIELLRGRYIECIAFSDRTDRAFCIPLTDGKRQPYWQSTNDEVKAWRLIAALLNQPETTYVTQNGLFDCWHLWRHGINAPFMANGFDTMLMHRLRAPDLPHNLGFLVSIYTREPYYKDESGDWTTQLRTVDDLQFYIYNCKDAACTLEVCHELEKDLAKHGMLDYYRSEIQAQWPVVTAMREVGLNVDRSALNATRDNITREINAAEATIERRLGWRPNTQSPLDMSRLYNQLGVKYATTPTGKPKRDIEQLYTQAYNHPQHRELLYSIANLNELRTLRSGFLGIALDERGFYHPSLSISKTVTGRLASAGADEGGPQIQNIPKPLRTLFVPDNPSTDEFTQADLKGAEAALLAFYTQDPLLIQAFEKDISFHEVRGCLIYRNWSNLTELPPRSLLSSIKRVCDSCKAKGEKSCPHSEYDMSKKNGHGFAYLEGVLRAMKEYRKKGIFMSQSDLETVKARVVTPSISNWHRTTELELNRSPWLVTPLGRKREFYGQLDSEMLRAALSWKCQAVVGQLTNRAMIALHTAFQPWATSVTPSRPRIVTQTHDSLLVTHHKSTRSHVKELLAHVFSQPITIHGRTFTIPLEITHGPNWKDLV